MCMNLLCFIMTIMEKGASDEYTECISDMYIPMERKIKTAFTQSLTLLPFF